MSHRNLTRIQIQQVIMSTMFYHGYYNITSSCTNPRMEKCHHPSHPFLSPLSTLSYISASNPIPIPYSNPLPSPANFHPTPAPLALSPHFQYISHQTLLQPSIPGHTVTPLSNPSFHHLPLFPSCSYHLTMWCHLPKWVECGLLL